MTIIDLTPIFLEAKSRASGWTLVRLLRFLWTLVDFLPMTTLDFDYESGVDWASIRYGKAAIAFVRREFPLMIIEEKWLTKIERLLEEEQIVVLLVPDMTSGRYSLDASMIPTIFPKTVWAYDVVDPKCFSLGELWWTTIT